ncbi:SLC5 family protein [Reichenbachiella ulvae]|uniref:Sodium/solute symporter n=1 Tax=Reichenbachiella ulvae TaxID=2980104 RepID=A0ABT3D0J4_9BACT|nr:sodium/solute symporter [Reichenbachiella ulvae]MCV9389284.1 sodium/solute symporter [Reichenbachiella ulvae]
MEITSFELHFADYVAFFGYFILLSLIGYISGKKKSTDAADYFLAGKTLPWYVVGSSYIAANISTEHFIGLIGAAVIYGISVATGEWSTVIAFTFLIWIFIPFLLSSNVYTAPEFLEKRFSKKLRHFFAILSIIANVVAFMGPVIYGGSLILNNFFGMDKVLSCFIIGITAGIWAIIGGLKSVAFMDVLTIIIMVGGGLAVTFLGLSALGDGEGMIAGFQNMIDINAGKVAWVQDWIDQNVVNILKGSEPGDNYERLSVLQPLNHYTNPWTHWVFSFFYIGLWYTVINQHMIQKVFAAKDMYHARMGMVFASFLKLLLPFIVVIPGMIYFAMKPEFLLSGDWGLMSDEANNTYIVMIGQLVPTFLRGVLLAALFGAIQSTVSSVLNSTSTMYVMDIHKEMINPQLDDQGQVRLGKVMGIVILFASIGIAIVLAVATKVNLFVFIQALYNFIAPPFSAIFLLGMLWRKVSGKDAMNTVLISFAFSAVLKILEFTVFAGEELSANATFWKGILVPFANQALLSWIVSMAVCSISAVLTAAPAPEQVSDDLTFNFKTKNFGGGLGNKWYTGVPLWSGLSIFLMLFMVLLFSVIL